jgi:uncharacterized protein (TIGR00251 family)
MAGLIKVKVVARAKRIFVKREKDNTLKVYLTAPPVEGKANKLLREVLAKYLKVPKSCLSILKGETSRNKIIKIEF